MNHPLTVLDDIQVATPCSADWDAMPGTDRVRHCAQCDQKVYDLSALSRQEATALVCSSEKVCIRLYRRPDGRVITRDCLAGKLLLVKRVTRRAALAAASCFGVVWWAFGRPKRAVVGRLCPPNDGELGDAIPIERSRKPDVVSGGLPPPPKRTAPEVKREDPDSTEDCSAEIPLPKVEPPQPAVPANAAKQANMPRPMLGGLALPRGPLMGR